MPDTPPPDLPDAASPTPAAAHPVTAPAAPGRPKVRSRPALVKAPRLPGTYAANSSDGDMNWRRGVALLWTIFGLTALLEIVRASLGLLAGYGGWPLFGDTLRIGVSAGVFAALWLGWSRARWLAVAIDFFGGMWLVLWTVALHMKVASTPGAKAEGTFEALIGTAPALALGMLYVAAAAYLAFSADLVDFTRHRREEGRGWVVLPVLALVAVYAAVVLTLQVPYGILVGWQGEGRGGSVRVPSAPWPQSGTRTRSPPGGDDHFHDRWPSDYLKSAVSSLSSLGELRNLDGEDAASASTAVDPSGGGFVVRRGYAVQRAEFAHGHARFQLLLSRRPFGPWRLDDLVVDRIQDDPAPDAAGGSPASTPTPAATGG